MINWSCLVWSLKGFIDVKTYSINQSWCISWLQSQMGFISITKYKLFVHDVYTLTWDFGGSKVGKVNLVIFGIQLRQPFCLVINVNQFTSACGVWHVFCTKEWIKYNILYWNLKRLCNIRYCTDATKATHFLSFGQISIVGVAVIG